jgi:hypothetical protein
MIKRLFVLAAVLLAGHLARSQDLIYKTDHEVVLAKVLELGADEIKYRLYNSTDSLIYGVAKMDVVKIKFENGKIMYFHSEMNDEKLYADNRKKLVKVDFCSAMFGQLCFAYEQSIKPGASWQADLVVLGIGNNLAHTDMSIHGGLVRFGYKFINTPDFALRGMRYSHLLKGGYVKPEFIFGFYSESYYYTVYNPGSSFDDTYYQKDNITTGALVLNFGKQWIMNNIFAVDVFAGIGYGFSTKTSFANAYDANYYSTLPYVRSSSSYTNYAYFGPADKFPMVFQAGLKIGLLLK